MFAARSLLYLVIVSTVIFPSCRTSQIPSGLLFYGLHPIFGDDDNADIHEHDADADGGDDDDADAGDALQA